MRVRTVTIILFWGISVLADATCFGQQPPGSNTQAVAQQISSGDAKSNQSSDSGSDEYIDKLLAIYKANSRNSSFITDPTAYQRYIAFKKAERSALHAEEEQRLDKQTSSSSGSGNTTSATSKASVPWLLGFAVEHGALTQSVENNLITFRGNVANIFKAFDAKDYVESYRRYQDNNLLNLISLASFSVSYASTNNSQASSSQGTLAGYSVHIDLYNHRDPRDRRYIKQWASVVNRSLTNLATRVGEAHDLITTKHPEDLHQWQVRANAAAQRLDASSPDAEIRTAIRNIADDYVKTFGQYDDVRTALQPVAAAAEEYSKQKGEVVQSIEKSPVISIEYTNTFQSATALPQSSTTTTTTTGHLPNLSNINLISELPLISRSQLTLNASTTLFTSLPAGSTSGTVRDYRFSAQTDIPLPELPQLGKSTLSFSGLFVSLLEEPLGQKILVNGVAESRRGNIGLFQATLSVPIKGAGVKVPISITASNRTELIKESDVRGTIGITLDIDSLFSRPQ
jgi:hypothetical protein